jgi:hypothetical protein
VIQGTFGVIQGKFGVIQGTFDMIQGTFGALVGVIAERVVVMALQVDSPNIFCSPNRTLRFVKLFSLTGRSMLIMM